MARPYVILGGFMSVDGKTAPANRKGRLLTPLMSETLLKRLHQLRADVDAVLVGAKTVIEDNPRLTVRAVQGRNPVRVVLDTLATIPVESEILKIKDAPTIVAVCEKAPEERTDRILQKGAEVMRFSCERQIPLADLLENLSLRGIRKILVEGGSEVRWSFVRERLFDELFGWITPLVLGGRNAPTLVDGEGFWDMKHSLKLRLKSHEVVDGTIILEYEVLKDR
jgi:2,5-diamino-6-(ribosylamino)-4(3H)-pyrimidinone 5'-phosphate reductase